MADDHERVKGSRRRLTTRFTDWVDCHPRTGWWVAGLMLVNTILNLLDLFVK